MSRIFDEIREEAAHECSVEIAERMLEAGELTYEEISRYAMLPLDEVKALAEKSTAKPSYTQTAAVFQIGKLPLFVYK